LSRLEDFEWMIRYLKMLDPTNAKIIEGLGKQGPRNVFSLAKSISLPPTTVAFRLKRLIKEGYLTIRTNLDYSRLGLRKAVLIAEAAHGREDQLQKTIESMDYWTYTNRCYGKFSGFYALFAFPAQHKDELEKYIEEAAKTGATSRYMFSWTTNLCEVVPDFRWFDFERKSWNFPWKRWIEEVLSAPEKLPLSLGDPKAYPVMVDETDVLLLKELEKDGSARFAKLAEVAKITPQGVRYRYYKHIVKRNLISDYQLAHFPYPLQVSDMCSFTIDFANKTALAKFANTLHNKPFTVTYGKMLEKNSLLLHTYTPKMEFSNFIESLNRLAEKDVIRSYFYVTLDLLAFKRQTISYEFFKDNKWTYDSQKKLKELRKIVSA